MIWPFKKKPAPPSVPFDARNWNEDWAVGDTAECVVDFDSWHKDVPPWIRLPKGSQHTVVGFCDEVAIGFNKRCYFLKLQGMPHNYETISFRKVIPLKKAEKTEIGITILQAKPAPDIKRTKPAKVPHD